ncbi:Protein phosphatase methylesterase 1 [Coniosporium tulheliwenetii]|uniref:Protein phosphatase methylesterase 1 n=1 Tax=Coniosporium tulheliwenetii TaxID=3383036 RepID=A0ACC2ZLC8_9PEZI|nr:Protein phosphatase methylesterase 1 [Cladosporium sp. JES 115]
MSDLVRSFARAKLSSLPPEPPLPEEQDREDDSSSASSVSSTGTVRPTSSHTAAPPTHWSDYFAQELYLERQSDHGRAKFHIYLTPPATPKAPLIVAHHGAGSSGLSFSLFARELRKLMPEAGVMSIDAREHGSSVAWDPSGEVDNDLSITTLSQDLVDVVRMTAAKSGWSDLPQLLLVGHSLGGAVVTETAKTGLLGNKLIGYAVLDVVEGSAMEALKSMQLYLSSRPSAFPSLDAAIEWHMRSRTIRNLDSARASVPSLLLQTPAGSWIWRTNLSKTEAYWSNWFDGMSSKFLSARGAKLLLLAGTDRLDKELMIGQMQGKFQLQVFPAAGHFVQEDLPEKTAEVIVEFLRRNDRSTLVLPPKVSDLLKQGKKV